MLFYENMPYIYAIYKIFKNYITQLSQYQIYEWYININFSNNIFNCFLKKEIKEHEKYNIIYIYIILYIYNLLLIYYIINF